MRNLARTAASSEIVRGVAPSIRFGIAVAVDDWIRARFRYRGEIEEVIRTPEFMLRTLQEHGYFDGDCDDVSTLTASILVMLGIPCRFVAIRYSSEEFQHVYVEAEQAGEWVPLDATTRPGTEYHAIERMVMDV